jgi:hypothetical protein
MYNCTHVQSLDYDFYEVIVLYPYGETSQLTLLSYKVIDVGY